MHVQWDIRVLARTCDAYNVHFSVDQAALTKEHVVHCNFVVNLFASVSEYLGSYLASEPPNISERVVSGGKVGVVISE
jgi:hypothetical protein